MTLRPLLIRWAMRLQYPPFTWLFRLYYILAILLTKRLVSRIDGVRSIYLSGSWARHEMIYGLSDLDFKIFVAGDKDQETYQVIRRIFSRLRRPFPMLGPPDEKGIYFLDPFAADYRHYPLMQFLFDERYFSHCLLWGEDIISNLPIRSWKELDQGACLTVRMKDWIERVHLLAESPALSREQKQHLFFKALSDTGLLAIRMDSPGYGFSRRIEVLERVAPLLEEPHRSLMGNLVREHLTFYRVQLNSMEENFQLFKAMLALCSEKVSRLDRTDPSPLVMEPRTVPCGEDEQALAAVLRGFSPMIRAVSVVRWPQLPLNPFDLSLFNAPAYLLDCARPLTLEEFRDLKSFYRHEMGKGSVVLLREGPRLLTSLDAELVDHWGGFPASSDLLHLYLGERKRRNLTLLERERIESRAIAFQEELEALLSHSEFGRVDLAVFPAFLFNALRILIFIFELRLGRWELPFTPSQVVDYLVGRTPLLPDFPNRLLRQYEWVRLGEGSFDERLMPKSRALLAGVLDISGKGDSWEPLKGLNGMADEHRLNISAAIITERRPMQLERAIHSLARLSRPPEELIVVGNEEDPLTRSLVEKLSLPFPLHYFNSERGGVASSRNVAVRKARGEIIAFLDDDAAVEPDWLERLERVFLRDPRIGLAAGSILNIKCGREDLVWKFMEIVEKI